LTLGDEDRELREKLAAAQSAAFPFVDYPDEFHRAA